MNKKEKIIDFIFVCFFLFIIWGVFFATNHLQETKIVLVERGEGVFEIADKLKKEELVNNPFFFNFYVLITGNRPNLQAGEYQFQQPMNAYQIARKIIEGKTTEEKIIIPEGWTIRDIAFYLENKGLFQAEEFFEVVGLPAKNLSEIENYPQPQEFNYEFLETKPSNVSLEGFIFPDTYHLERGFEVRDLINKALINFDQKINQNIREEISKQNKTIFEIITMASLIEKEVIEKEDKEIVAGILWKRSDNDMPLQVDSTILYFTGKKNEIFKKDIETDSPYNTYKIKGLPLGPICNPSLESIRAAIYPKESSYWYYLSAPSGKTIFSETLEEHNIAKFKYLK